MYRMNEKPFKFREMKRINADAKLRTEFDAREPFYFKDQVEIYTYTA